MFKKFLSYFYGSGVGLIIGLFTTIISTRFLSPEDFGKASMFTLAVNVIMIFIIFGTDQAFVRFYYEEIKELRLKLLLNIIKVPLIILGVVMIIIFIFKDIIMIFLFNESNQYVFWVLIFSIVFQVIYRFTLLIIRMEQKGHLYSIMEIINKSSNLIFLVILYYLIGPEFEILIFSYGITLIILVGMSLFIERSFWKPLSKHTLKEKHSQVDIIKFSFPLVLTTLITWLIQSFDRIAISHWNNFDELGLYSASFRIVALLTIVQAAFSTFWSPICYEYFEKQPENRIFFSKTSKVVSFVMFEIAIITIVFKDVIVMMLGDEYSKAAVIMPFLIFMPMMYTISETTVLGINFFKKTKWHVFIASITCLINIIGNILLVPEYGAIGAAISTGLSFIIFFVTRTQISLKYYKVDYGLKKIYLIIAIMTLYAFQNIIWSTDILTYLTGVFLMIFVGIIYKIEVLNILSSMKKRREVK